MSSSQHKQAPASTPLVQSTVGHCSAQGELQSSHVTQLTAYLVRTMELEVLVPVSEEVGGNLAMVDTSDKEVECVR